MALHQISLSSPSSSMALRLRSATPPPASASDYLRCATAIMGDRCLTTTKGQNQKRRRRGVCVVVRSSLEMTEPVVGQVTAVGQDTFWPLVKASGDKVVVLDMYTQWCGPCKIIAPKFKQLAEKHLDVVFLKLDCNQENKALAKELGIRVVPTFKILKDNKVVKEVTGAKLDDLIAAIEIVKSS